MSGEADTVEALEQLSEDRKRRSKEENEQKAKRDAEERERRLEEERRRINELHGIITPPFKSPYDNGDSKGDNGGSNNA